jgi:hypothetical protein
MDASKNSHVAAAFVKRAQVWYEGTDALAEGTALCFNIVRGTATAPDGTRSSYVIRPTAATAKAFAGVAARDYTAKAGGQFIEINTPGSLGVKVRLTTGNTTIGVTNLVFVYGTGTGGFVANSGVGQGSALAVQTTTGAAFCYANLGEGVQSGGVDADA